MATLEQDKHLVQPTPLAQPLAPSGTVPTAFPAMARTASLTGHTNAQSRSPSATRHKIGGMLDKVKRAMSSSRDRGGVGAAGEGEMGGGRGRSGERRRESLAGTITEEHEQRGRTGGVHFPATTTHPLHATTTGTTFASSKSTSRSASRGRHITLGRGGAGNLLASSSGGGGELPEHAGEESPEDVERARQERSRSRGRRAGQEEVFLAGRGGRGNMRAESRETGEKGGATTTAEERLKALERDKAIEEEMRRKKGAEKKVFTSGRGGAGNMRYTSPPREKDNATRV